MRSLVIILVITATAVVLVLVFRANDAGNDVDVVTVTDTEESVVAAPVSAATPSNDGPPPVTGKELPQGVHVVPSVISDARFTRLDDGRSLSNEGYAAARALHQPETPPQEDLEQLNAVFDLFLWAYRELPEGGENHEMMARLTGENSHQVIFFPPDHESFDAEGALLDRWGSPYFMHKISGQQVDIVSSGPDRELWTTDDLRIGPTDDFESASVE
jgi:hypothetical protein